MKTRITLLSIAILADTLLLHLSQGQGFPPIGYDSGPGIILTVDSNGFLNVASTGQGPYDNIEDTYIGIINNSPNPLCGIRLQSPDAVFAFDGDGPCGLDPNTGDPYSPSPCSPDHRFGLTGYEGPGVTFSNINATETGGTVNFNPPLSQGEATWFALEESINVTCSAISGIVHKSQGCGNNNACPSTPAQCDAAGWTCANYARYTNAFDTIGKWGCNLTACAMLINYHTGTNITPGDLNNWLNTQPDGWMGDSVSSLCGSPNRQCGGPNPRAVARYANISYIGSLPFRRPTGCGSAGGTSNDFVVNSYLCSGNPVILWVNGISHFVLGFGEAQGSAKYQIDDPGHRSVHDLSFYSSQYDGIFAYSSAQTPPQALLITGHSPIELVLNDPSGNQTGVDPITTQSFDEIPNATYHTETITDGDDPTSGQVESETKVLDVPGALDGTYLLKVTGTGNGPFTVDFVQYDSAGTPSGRTVSGVAAPGSIVEYQINYSSEPGSQITVVPFHQVTTSSLPSNGGVTAGGGSFADGTNVTVTAIANSGYTFRAWAENRNVVSTAANYSFSLTSDRNLVAIFTSNKSVTAPHIYPAGGTFGKKVIVTMSCDTPGATIYYTTNGSDPTTSSSIYPTSSGKRRFGGITISGSGLHTIKAKGVKTGYNDSPISIANLTIK